jgi:hypothetical protein
VRATSWRIFRFIPYHVSVESGAPRDLCYCGRVGFLGSIRILILPTGKLPSLRNNHQQPHLSLLPNTVEGILPSKYAKAPQRRNFSIFTLPSKGRAPEHHRHRKSHHFLNFLHSCKASHSQVSSVQLCTPNMTESASGDVTGN